MMRNGPWWLSKLTRGLDRERGAGRVLSRVYGAGLNWFYGDGGIDWITNGEHVRIHPAVRGKIPPLNEVELFTFLKDGVRPGQVVFDVGTFIGTYAVFEARWVGPGGRVVAFEPTAKNWPMIEAHLKMNGVADRVELIRAAAGDRSGHTTFYQHHRDSDQNSVLPLLTEAGTATRVPMVTLDEIAETLNLMPDWIRMDVQGFEVSVLRGAQRILAQTDKPVRIVVELHPGIWSLNGSSVSDVREALRALGLAVKPIPPATELFPDGGHVELVRG
jgi:FkbM family methyltransferase